MKINRLQAILLLIIGGCVTASGFPPLDFIIGPMIGALSLLFVEHSIAENGKRKKVRVYFSAYLFFAVLNFASIWWVKNAAWVGVISSVVVNSIFYALMFLFFHMIKQKIGKRSGYFSFVILWLAWEYVELLDWDLSWPWVTLGFMPANWPKLIQWYSYTGSLGGSLWFLLINVYLFFFLKSWIQKEDPFFRFKILLRLLLILILPITISLIQYYNYEEDGSEVDVIVIQPNREVYSNVMMADPQKMLSIDYQYRVPYMLSLADSIMDEDVDYVLMPETAFQGAIWDSELYYHRNIRNAKNWLGKYPSTNLITGINYYGVTKVVNDEVPFDVSYSPTEGYFRRYNSGVQINNTDSISLYHKSRLVIGVERIPSYFVFLQRYLEGLEHEENVSEYNPNNGTQEERSVFIGVDSAFKAAPVICYESVFGEHVADYVSNGANFIAVITNDAWWGDTPGYKQHWSFSKLRAIENRRSVARSANTGWSGFIDQRGEDVFKSDYFYPGAYRRKIKVNNDLTFYTKYGDIVGRISVMFGVLLLLNLLLGTRKSLKPKFN